MKNFIVSDIYYDRAVSLTKNYLDIKLSELGSDSIVYYRICGTQLSTLHERPSLTKKIFPNYCPKLSIDNIIDNPIFYVILNYPLSKVVEIPINIMDLTWIDLFMEITNVYSELFYNQDKYGVYFWGHSINDLDLGHLIFRKDPVYNKNIILLYIDS